MVASNPPAPGPRASDVDRQQVIEALRDGSVDGRLSHETFLRRIDLALHARHLGELAELVADLRPPACPRRDGPLVRAVGAWSELTLRIQAAWRAPRLPPLVLPRDGREALTIGRAADCDLVVPDMTVSGRHAELRRAAGGWLLVDLNSTNGTRLNGWRVSAGSEVRDGDVVAFGHARLRVSAS